MSETQTERFLNFKQLQDVLCKEYGLCYTVRYLREVRKAAMKNSEPLFVGFTARPSEVISWMKAHPNFSRPR